MRKILITNGRVVDPVNNIDEILDILIENGKIKTLRKKIKPTPNTKVINARNKIVCPGIIDMHVHLRDPGHEEEETIYTGTLAAAHGGVTTICCMPNTHPPIDNQTSVEFVMLKAKNEGIVKVRVIGAATKGLKGEELSEIGELKSAGVVAVSDDGNPIMNALIMRRILEYAKMFNLAVISHCEDLNLTGDGVMNEGYISTLLGLRGIPSASEDVMVARDIILAKLTGGHVHIAHVTTSSAVELIRQAKKQNIKITAEVTPHHFSLTDEAVKTYDTNTKIKPPLRTKNDIEALIEGLKDGTIDCIVSDHAPHSEEEKNKEYDYAPFGIIGLETLLPLTITNLVMKNKLTLSEAIAKLTINPARILNLDTGRLSPNSPADILIFDIKNKKKIDKFYSKSKNTPFLNQEFYGIPEYTIVDGRIVLEDGKPCPR